MRTILIVGMLVVVAAVQSARSSQGEPEKALQDASAARLQSMNSGDAEGWGKYTTDDFMVIEENGAVKTKAQRMTEIEATPAAAANTASDQKWRVYGPN